MSAEWNGLVLGCSGAPGGAAPSLCVPRGAEGFPGKAPWRVLGETQDGSSAAVGEQSQLLLSKDLPDTCRMMVLPEGQRIWAAVVKPGVSAEGGLGRHLLVCLSDLSFCRAWCLLVSCWDVTSENLFTFLKVSRARSSAASAVTSAYPVVTGTTREEIPPWSRQFIKHLGLRK